MARGGKVNAKPTNVGKPAYQKAGKTAKDRRTATKGAWTVTGRKILYDTGKARSAAKGKTTKAAKRGVRAHEPGRYSESKGAALKKGIEGMARRTNLDEETYNRLMAMDERSLQALYENNDIVFEIAFNYGGVSTDPETGAYIVDENKNQDFDFLIEQYNKMFPESAV